MSPPNWFGEWFGATGSLQTNGQIIGLIGNRVYGCVRFKRAEWWKSIEITMSRTYNAHTVHRIKTVVTKATTFSLINIVTDLIRRETQKPFYIESGTINTAMYGVGWGVIVHFIASSGIFGHIFHRNINQLNSVNVNSYFLQCQMK